MMVHVLDRNARFELPFAVDSEEATLHHTYLDTSGRPVLVLHKKNIVAEHNQHFLVTYNFSKTSMLLEPLILVISYFVVFLIAMLYVRFDLSISKVSIRIPDSHPLPQPSHSPLLRVHLTLLYQEKVVAPKED